MLTLHGFPFSNYHNIVKHTLLYKGIPFEEHIAYPGSAELMAVSPAGKAPAKQQSEVHNSPRAVYWLSTWRMHTLRIHFFQPSQMPEHAYAS